MVGWHHCLSGHELSKLQEMVKDSKAWYAVVHAVAKSQTWLRDWTTTEKLSMLGKITQLASGRAKT